MCKCTLLDLSLCVPPLSASLPGGLPVLQVISEADLKELLTDFVQKAAVDPQKTKASKSFVFVAILACIM